MKTVPKAKPSLPGPRLVPLPPPTLDSAYQGAIGRLMILRAQALDEGAARLVIAAEMALETLMEG